MKKLFALLLVLTLLPLSFSAFAETSTTVKIMGFERKIAENVFFSKRETQAVWQAAEKLFTDNGIKFDFEIIEDREQYKTTIQTRLASNHELPDMCYTGTMSESDVLDLAEMGIVLPMNEVLETTKGAAYQYFYGGEGDTARKMLSDANGNFYWLPRIQMNQIGGESGGTSMGVCIRLDWLQKLNLEVPKTLDEFTAALRAFQENDMNGNGLKDEVALLDTSGFYNGIQYWFGMVQDFVGVNVTEGKVETPWYSPVAKEYFAYIKSLVDEGLLYADAIGADTDFSQLKNDNKVSAMYYYPVGTYAENAMRAAGHKEAYYIGIEPFAAVENVQPFYSEETPYLVYMKYVVTNAAKDKLEAVAKVYDTIYSEEFINIMDWGVEGRTYQVVNGEKSRLTIGVSWADLFDQGNLGFDALARFFFPTIFHNERLQEIALTEEQGWGAKGDFERKTANYPRITPNDNSGYYALSTPEETEVLSTRLTDLATYSRELAADLSLGRKSLDDWDSYIAELKNLGLDEVLAIRQAQLDRRNGK